ncbi:AmmeMemoRadiSam system protein B [Aureliella helgolandensis]|uniref:AMMECR1 domain-containing protein n=1 Tax=Aureliella helgolandensis TaxID=2527968 RepID=A0A518GHG7_9BACT|nr:AmmeMemoRadiSam system protein B [Aureliella helgolandensis]QDV28041.1 hypothetical protein Q31a_64340 [Aureliella helgolandensis]
MSANSDVSVSSTPAAAVAAQGPLKLEGMKAAQRHSVVQAAASWVAEATLGQPVKSAPEMLGDLGQRIVMGAFVTLKRGEVLRGCCGVLGKPMTLGAAIVAAAQRTAKEDNRFAPISPCELPFLTIDVTLLGPFQPIAAEGAARAQAISIGKQGVMVQRGQQSGLLLPSVAVERKLDGVRFLQAVCLKAGLPIGAWEEDDVKVMTFHGEPMGGSLAELLPLNLPTSNELPISEEQLSAYAQLAGGNIVAMATGGTPSYVVPQLPDMTVNAIVLSMQWGAEESEESARRQGSALQVSLRPGIPLQSTLFQMCQRAAGMFQQDRFAGQLQIGITLGFDPALHGWGRKADLDGVDSSLRGLVISDAQHCGFAFDPRKTAEELRELLRGNLPISSRDAMLHSMHVVSTMPHLISISGPNAVAGSGIRPPAVGGKFYPAEDAARRAAVGALLDGQESVRQQTPLAILVPHAALKFSGQVAANVWRRVADLDSKTIIVLSPKHTRKGVHWSVCPFSTWRLSHTTAISGDAELAKQLAAAVDPILADAAAHEEEHGIEVQLPFIERFAPNAKLLGLALNGGSWDDIQAAAVQMAEWIRTLETQPLLVISSDMNHYAPDPENRRRDRLALDALASCDPEHLIGVCSENEISMCGLVPAAFVLETLRQLGHALRVEEVDYATSAEVNADKSQVVGYAGALILSDPS